jgi:THO complex subunit 2
LNCVNNLSKTDERDDVKIPAASLIGDLNRREKKWMLPQEFSLIKVLPGDPGQPKSGSQPPGQSPTPTNLNAAAPEFQPTALE